MELRLIVPEPVNGVTTVDLRGAVVAPPPGGGTVDPPPTGGGGGGTLPSNVTNWPRPYPTGSQDSIDLQIGDIARGVAMTIPANAAPHKGIIKVFGQGSDSCPRDRRIDKNGVVWRDWFVDPLGITTNDNYTVGPGADDVKPGDQLILWMRHPTGEVRTDRIDWLANQ